MLICTQLSTVCRLNGWLYAGAIACRRVHIVAKSACYLPLLCPPPHLFACIGAAFFPRISMRFYYTVDFDGYLGKIQIWLNSGKNVEHFTRTPKYVLVLPTKLNRHKSALFE